MPALKGRVVPANVAIPIDGFRVLGFRLQKSIVHLLVIIAAVFHLHANAQTSHTHRKENFDVHEFRVKTINLSLPGDTMQVSDISSIKVIDARADTGRIGFMQKKIIKPLIPNPAFRLNENQRIKDQEELAKRRLPTFLKLGPGVKAEVEQFVNRYVTVVKNDALPSVLMVIKKMWLSDELDVSDNQANNANIINGSAGDQWSSGIDVKIEFYLKSGGAYYPLYRYDSVVSRFNTVSEYGPGFVALAIRLSLQKMKFMHEKIAGIATHRKFSIEEIEAHNSDAFNLPVLKDSVLKAGVYMNFDEFKNNNPSEIHFELRRDKLIDVLHIKQADGKEYVARDVWGYCDGEYAYIRSVDNFFLLQRSENAFYIFGAKKIISTANGSLSSPKYGNATNPPPNFNAGTQVSIGTDNISRLVTDVKFRPQLKPFQLDWSTGKLY